MKLSLIQVLFVMTTSWQVTHALTGDNVCQVNQQYSDIKPHVVTRTKNERYTVWCGFLWLFKCSRYREHDYTETQFQTEIKWRKVEVCCKGYRETTDGKCERNCAILPCPCNPGFALNSGKCSPICPMKCESDICANFDDCVCSEGYERSLSKPYTCVSLCSEDCKHGTCTNLDNCECNEGYEKSPTAPFNCVPLCYEDGVNQTCTNPDNCTCRKGYEMSTVEPFNCLPLCSEGCSNNTCSEGYSKDNLDSSTCNYMCTCSGANCSVENTCMCSEGCDNSTDHFKDAMSAETVPWGFVGAAFVIIIIVITGCIIGFVHFTKRSEKNTVDNETMLEPNKVPKIVCEDNSLYTTLDVLRGTKFLQESSPSRPEADSLYVNAVFKRQRTTVDSEQEENPLYGAFQLSTLTKDANIASVE